MLLKTIPGISSSHADITPHSLSMHCKKVSALSCVFITPKKKLDEDKLKVLRNLKALQRSRGRPYLKFMNEVFFLRKFDHGKSNRKGLVYNYLISLPINFYENSPYGS